MSLDKSSNDPVHQNKFDNLYCNNLSKLLVRFEKTLNHFPTAELQFQDNDLSLTDRYHRGFLKCLPLADSLHIRMRMEGTYLVSRTLNGLSMTIVMLHHLCSVHFHLSVRFWKTQFLSKNRVSLSKLYQRKKYA